MPGGGQLKIKSATQSPDWIAITISDTGEGIPQENISKLFEPLFTTKAKGIGLGLALVKTLIERHDGTISVESVMGKGTTFVIKLPVNKNK